MLDVKRRGRDVRAFVTQMEAWLIDVLASFGISGKTHSDRVGVWVPRSEPETGPETGAAIGRGAATGAPATASSVGGHYEDKIGAIGIRLRKWISYHGMSLNINPDLSHFDGIVPCGITGHGVTSLIEQGQNVSVSDVDTAIRLAFEHRFGPTVSTEPSQIMHAP